MPIDGTGMSSIHSPVSAFAFTKAFTESPENYYPAECPGSNRRWELHESFTAISRLDESFWFIMNP
jgi:hypothetical protein